MIEFQLNEVPPPKSAPFNEAAQRHGLVRGLQVEERSRQYRCACCNRMQPSGSLLVWVPDSVMKGDPDWSVQEACRLGAYNGSGSGWCISCAPKAPRNKSNKARPGFLKRLFG